MSNFLSSSKQLRLTLIRDSMYQVTFKDGTPPKVFTTVEEGFKEWIKGGNRDLLKKVEGT